MSSAGAVDSSYLKDELGPVLARGIAETCVARPRDPIEYLGLWLRHYLDEKEYEAQERAKEEEVKTQREEWNRQHAAREKVATESIQKEWKVHVVRQSERSDRETDLKTKLEAFGERLDEDGAYDPESIGYEALTDAEATEEVKEKELDYLKSEKLFQRWRMYLGELNKGNVADVKVKTVVSPLVTKIYRCVFYLLGKLPSTTASGAKLDATPSRLVTWQQIRANIKPHPFLESLKAFDPATAPKRAVNRVRRILNPCRGQDEILKESGGQVTYIVSQWLFAAVEYRCNRDDIFKVKKEGGKEMPGMDGWEEDPGEEAEGEEKDPDEEEQKQIEEELRKQQEAEGKEEDAGDAEE